jgi:hypothetical protein
LEAVLGFSVKTPSYNGRRSGACYFFPYYITHY